MVAAAHVEREEIVCIEPVEVRAVGWGAHVVEVPNPHAVHVVVGEQHVACVRRGSFADESVLRVEREEALGIGTQDRRQVAVVVVSDTSTRVPSSRRLAAGCAGERTGAGSTSMQSFGRR